MNETTKKKKGLVIAPVDGLYGMSICLLPSCNALFKPDPDTQRYCRPSHQRAGHKLAKKVGTEIILSGTLYCECVGGVFGNGRKEV